MEERSLEIAEVFWGWKEVMETGSWFANILEAFQTVNSTEVAAFELLFGRDGRTDGRVAVANVITS